MCRSLVWLPCRGPPLLGIDARSAVRESRLQPSCIRESRLLSSSNPTCFASALLKYHVVCACVDRRLGSRVVGRPQSLSRSAAWPLSPLLFPGISHSEVFRAMSPTSQCVRVGLVCTVFLGPLSRSPRPLVFVLCSARVQAANCFSPFVAGGAQSQCFLSNECPQPVSCRLGS